MLEIGSVSDSQVADAITTSGPVCRWEAPDGSSSIVLGSDLLEELRRRSIEGYLSLPKRGAEIGGLLLGHVHYDGTTRFEIVAYEEIPCEYRFGPSYKLSETDRHHLSQRAAQHQLDGSTAVIGMFRSYTGREASLDESDDELARSLFPDLHIVLLLQPVSADKCPARFQLRDGREPATNRVAEPLVMEAAQTEQTETAAVEVRQIEAPPPPAIQTEKPAVLPPSYGARRALWQAEAAPSPRRKVKLWMILLLCGLVCAGGVGAYRLWMQQSQPRWEPLGLQATAAGRGLVLHWNPATAAIQHATRGMITVADGASQQLIPLTGVQLRGGQINYVPSHSNVSIKLLVFDGADRSSGDSLSVANFRSSEPAPAVVPPAVVKPAETRPVETAIAAGAKGEVPAVAQHEVQPLVPPGIKARIRIPTVVPVQLHINPSGRVTRATAKVNASGLNRYLAEQATKAARQWTFAPAHLRDGRAIASVKKVEFVFMPSRSR